MNTLSHWSPLRELEGMRVRLGAIFGHAPLTKDRDSQEALRVAHWVPLVDITEDDEEYLIKAALPEIKKEDVKVSMDHNILTISGERRMDEEDKGKKYHRMESAYGSFVRSFALPDEVDGGKATSEYKDGVLKIHLPKSEKSKPTNIEVKVT